MRTETEKPLFYEFADFRVDAEKRLLWREGEQILLTPKVFDLLLTFLERRGEVLEKDDLMNLLWADSFVEESNLAQNVAVLRKALGENSKEHKFILTIPGRGYRFVAEVKELFAGDEISTEKKAGEFVWQENFEAKTTLPKTLNAGKKWLFAATTLVLLAVGGLAFWFFSNRNKTDETLTIVKTTQITSWTGLDCFPSISPDGNTIAFSSDRTGNFEIYIKQLVTGANEVQITSDGGQNFEPAFSPDGSLIAFHSQKRGGIWVVPVTGGSPKQITDFGARPAWSPDGSQIVFQSHPLADLGYNANNAMPPSTIWIVSINGGETKQITEEGAPPGGHGAPSFSPDGKRIVFGANDLTTGSVWTVSAEGGNLKKIFGRAFDPIFAPDGRSIFVIALLTGGRALEKINISANGEPIGEPVKIFGTSGSNVRQISIDGKGKRIIYSSLSTASNIYATPLTPNANEIISNPVSLTQNANIRTLAPAFSPDGKKIVFQTFGSGINSQIWIMDSDGKNKTQLTTVGGLGPWWFPDGKRVFFRVDREDRVTLWTVTIDGAKEKKLFEIEGTASYGRLSPDGKQVAFNSVRSGTQNIWLVPIEGGEPKQLTFDKEAMSFAAWSPDGKWIGVGMNRGADTQIAIISGEGGEPLQLTFDKGQSWIYDWSPDNDKILFAGQRDGLWNIYWVSRSTKEVKKLTNFAKLNAYVRYPTWSPLNTQIVYEYAETTGNIWMIELK